MTNTIELNNSSKLPRRTRRAYDRYSRKYCNAFEKLVQNDQSLNMFKCLVALMRSGKTFWCIEHNIPYILNNTDCKVAILTAPLAGIVSQNVKELRAMCTKNGFFYCESALDVEYALENDMKAVLYMTNQGAWTKNAKNTQGLFDKLIEDKVMIATFMDEAWTWTISDIEVVEAVSGNPRWSSDVASYEACWYNTMFKIAQYSPYTYGLSATKTSQLDGTIPPTYGSMGYKIGIDFLNPKELSHRLGWMGNVVYFSEGTLDVNSKTPRQAFDLMVKNLYEIEQRNKILMEDDEFTKRTAMIQCNVKIPNAKVPTKHTILDVVEWVKECDYPCEGHEFIGCVLTSSKKYLFNKNGDISSTTEEEIYRLLDDESHPLRFCLVMNMAKMGVTIRTWKEILIFNEKVKMNKYGHIVYQKNQTMGRGLTPNAGMSSKDFWKHYDGDLGKVPQIPIELNSVNLYLWDNPTNVDAVKIFERDFCPTYEDFTESSLDCPFCGADQMHHRKDPRLFDNIPIDDMELIDAELGI